MALKKKFTYLLGPIKIALRPRIITATVGRSGRPTAGPCGRTASKLEKMWQAGELDDYIDIEEEELEIARLQPWHGGPAIFAADGLFGFGAHVEGS
jgi:hypothetical protein